MRWYWIDRFEKFVAGVEAVTAVLADYRSFDRPVAVWRHHNFLYVADQGNHRIGIMGTGVWRDASGNRDAYSGGTDWLGIDDGGRDKPDVEGKNDLARARLVLGKIIGVYLGRPFEGVTRVYSASPATGSRRGR